MQGFVLVGVVVSLATAQASLATMPVLAGKYVLGIQRSSLAHKSKRRRLGFGIPRDS